MRWEALVRVERDWRVRGGVVGEKCAVKVEERSVIGVEA